LEKPPPTVPGVFHFFNLLPYMVPETQTESDEPVGIVISNGGETEQVPRFTAYVWGPAPEDELEPDAQPV